MGVLSCNDSFAGTAGADDKFRATWIGLLPAACEVVRQYGWSLERC